MAGTLLDWGGAVCAGCVTGQLAARVAGRTALAVASSLPLLYAALTVQFAGPGPALATLLAALLAASPAMVARHD